MKIDESLGRPIFLQLAEGIEDAILSGAFPEGQPIPSITEFSVTYKINPATALKGVNIMVDAGAVFKKRGLGMFVADGAVEMLAAKRRQRFAQDYVAGLVAEARRLGISLQQLVALIEESYTSKEEGEQSHDGN